VPRLYGQFLAYVLYRWEIILRESAIFGILGVLTLGYYIDAAISEFRLDVAVVLILVTALLSMAVDAFSRGLRRRLRIDTMPTRLSEAPSEPAIGRLVGAEKPAGKGRPIPCSRTWCLSAPAIPTSRCCASSE